MQGTILAGRYKIVRDLARGGFGETYLAEDQLCYNSLCVVKQLKPQFNDPVLIVTAKELFNREAEVLHRLGEHNQIPQLLAYFEENQKFYLVQEFIEGKNLTQILSVAKTLSEPEVITLLQDILKILDYVHNNDVIHRDIKPANLMRRDKDGKIVLIDFGAVKERLSEPTTIAIGTPGYTPDEQNKKNPQFCSDIYALGMVGIETLTGLRPTKLTRDSQTDEINELALVNISPNLVRILNKMVKSDFHQRYQLASEVLPALEQLGSVPDTLPPTKNPNSDNKQVPASKPPRRLSRRRYFWQVAIGVGTAAVILIAPGIWIYNWLTNYTPLVCLVQNVPKGSFSYGGSTTWTQILQQVDPDIRSVCPEFKLRYVRPPVGESGSEIGIKMLLNDQIDFAVSSRHLKDEEYQAAKLKGFGIEEIPVALDGIAIAVHPNLSVSGLTITQLKEILTGKITNWKQVDGPDLKITVYARKPSSTFNFIQENVLQGQPLRQDIEVVPTITEGVKKVASDPGSIYLASASYLVSQCTIKTLPVGGQRDKLIPPYRKPLVSAAECTDKQKNQPNLAAFHSGNYRLTRYLFVLVKQNGRSEQQAGEAYANVLLTFPRQELIEKAGFLRIR